MELINEKATEINIRINEASSEQLLRHVSLATEIGKSAVEANVIYESEDAVTSSEAQQDLESFSIFYKEIYRRLFYFASKQLGDTYTAEDITAETMVIVFKKWNVLKTWLHETDGKDRLHGYVFGIIKNTILNMHTKRATRTRVITSNIVNLHGYTDDVPESHIYEWDVELAIKQLPLQQRQEIGMTMLGFESKEIAEILGIPRSTVRSRLAVARRSLGIILGDDEYSR